MDTEFAPGQRCRSTRTILHRGGTLDRASPGTVRSARDNLGRRLIHVDFDSGASLLLFADEIEPIETPGEAPRG